MWGGGPDTSKTVVLEIVVEEIKYVFKSHYKAFRAKSYLTNPAKLRKSSYMYLNVIVTNENYVDGRYKSRSNL